MLHDSILTKSDDKEPVTRPTAVYHGSSYTSQSGCMGTYPVKCYLCQDSFMDHSQLNNHISRCHRNDFEMPFSCHQCSKGFMTQPGLQRHMITHQGKQFTCPLCGHKFTQKSSVKSHLKSVHGSSQCPTCFSILAIGDSYNKHLLHCK